MVTGFLVREDLRNLLFIGYPRELWGASHLYLTRQYQVGSIQIKSLLFEEAFIFLKRKITVYQVTPLVDSPDPFEKMELSEQSGTLHPVYCHHTNGHSS